LINTYQYPPAINIANYYFVINGSLKLIYYLELLKLIQWHNYMSDYFTS